MLAVALGSALGMRAITEDVELAAHGPTHHGVVTQ